MVLNCFVKEATKACPIHVVTPADYADWLKGQNEIIQQWLTGSGYKAEAGNVEVIRNAKAEVVAVICCIAAANNFWGVGGLSLSLPVGVYQFSNFTKDFAIAWGLGAYQFTRYKKPSREPAKLLVKDDLQDIQNIVSSIYLVRDLINTPTEDLGPTELAGVVEDLCKDLNAEFKQLRGNDLVKNNYPLIHAVGRACDDEPRLLDMCWGNPKHPKVTLVGKGVCFDTGGLDIKGSSYMLLMKKDMGGAANVLGLARMIILAKLPVRLRVLIPAVENSVSGNAYRPGDVINSRKGLTIEIGNTDAEGRLVLADALTEAVSESPDLLIDMSTLTGAARVAVGTEIAAVFANQDEFVNELITKGNNIQDPICRLPLFAPYRESLNSPIADLNNCSSDSYAGAITAALFLKEFVPDNIPWLHFDIMAWNVKSKPGRPMGGEAMALRALFVCLQDKYT